MAYVTVSVKVDKRALDRLIRDSPSQARAAAKGNADALRADVVRRMPRRTRETARKTVVQERGPYDYAVAIPEVPGRFLIEGTKPHIIRAKGRGFLRFMGRGGGVVFARMVNHPGTKANSFAADAARAALTPFQRAVARIFGG